MDANHTYLQYRAVHKLHTQKRAASLLPKYKHIFKFCFLQCIVGKNPSHLALFLISILQAILLLFLSEKLPQAIQCASELSKWIKLNKYRPFYKPFWSMEWFKYSQKIRLVYLYWHKESLSQRKYKEYSFMNWTLPCFMC